MNLRIVFKFKDCKLQFYEKQRLFSYFIVNPRTPASRWRRLLKLKRKNIDSFKIIIGFFFTPPLLFCSELILSCRELILFCRELILFCSELILFCRELILFCRELILQCRDFLFCRDSCGPPHHSSKTPKTNRKHAECLSGPSFFCVLYQRFCLRFSFTELLTANLKVSLPILKLPKTA